jgi:hypothetical protein
VLRPPHDDAARRAPARRAIVVLRAVGFAAALVLGGVALWLIVTGGDSARRVQIGVLLGLWGLLLGAYAVVSSRNEHPPAAAPAADAVPGAALEVRRALELERAEDAAARRDYEARLVHMVRREIQTTVSGELSALRADLATLRGELLDNVGGQLRLERIETTRVIGSDIEALQREVDQLKATRMRSELDQQVSEAQPVWRPEQSYARTRPAPPTPMDATAPFEPIRDEILAEVVQSPVVEDEPATAPAPAPVAEPAVEPQAVEPQAVEPQAVEELAPIPMLGSDAFAGLPRLRPFTDEPLGVLGSDESAAAEHAVYQGRRRSDAERQLGSRHSSRPPTEAPTPGGRRRRAAGDGNDTLDRILQREGAPYSS